MTSNPSASTSPPAPAVRGPAGSEPRRRTRDTVGLVGSRVESALLVTLPLLAGALLASTVAVPGPDASGDVADSGPVPLGLLLGLAVAVGLAAALRALVRRRSDRPFRAGRRRVAIAGIAAVVLLITAFFWWWQPNPTPAVALNAHLTTGVGAGAVALLSCLVALGCTRPSPSDSDDLWILTHWTRSWWGRGAAVLVALALTAGVGWLADRAGRAYLDSANEYRETPAVATGPVSAPASGLTGGSRWTLDLRLYDLPSTLALTRYGVLVTDGHDVVSVDPATGAEQWRYYRSDVDDTPRPSAIDGGNRVLVDWTSGHDGFVVLDAHDGHRIARWPDGFDDDDLQNRVPGATALLLGRQVGVGSDSVARVDDDGSTRWRYAPGRCRNLQATATRSTAVVAVQDSCGDPSQLVGLDLATGRQRWSVNGRIDVLAAVGDTLITGHGPGYGELTAIDAVTGRTRWTRSLVSSAGALDCTDSRRTDAVTGVVQVSCDLAGGGQPRLLQLDTGTGAVRADVPVGPDILDVGLTSDGRGLVLSDQQGTPTLTVVADGGTRRVPLDLPVDSGTEARLALAGDLVLVGTGTRLQALR